MIYGELAMRIFVVMVALGWVGGLRALDADPGMYDSDPHYYGSETVPYGLIKAYGDFGQRVNAKDWDFQASPRNLATDTDINITFGRFHEDSSNG